MKGKTIKIRKPMNKKGFTLIEIVLAIGIFSIITLAAYSLLLTGFKLYGKNTASIEEQRSLRMVFMSIDSDLRSYAGGIESITASGSTLNISDEITYNFNFSSGEITRTQSGTEAVIASSVGSFIPVVGLDGVHVTITGAADGQSIESEIKLRDPVD